MRDNESIRGMTCKNCGAPVTTEICPFCGVSTGLVTAQADMTYPVLECKEATLNFWTVAFPAIFAFTFSFFGFLFPIILFTGAINESDISPLTVLLFCVPFAVIGVIAFVLMLKPIIRYILLRAKGKKITATVYGYTDDNLLINGAPAQVVKLLVDTPEGYRFIMYQLGDTTQPYGINTEIGLTVYKDYFLIEKPQKHYIQWR